MTIKEAKEYFRESLFALYHNAEILALERIVFDEIFNASPAELILKNEEKIEPEKQSRLEGTVSKLKNEIPIQYIFGHTGFCDLEISVNENVLIPRPETEELVDWIIKENNAALNQTILDIGTGSGCIILSLANKIQNATCFATDTSERALKVAEQNAKQTALEVTFSKHDILKNPENPFDCKYDVIVSNPPYVLASEKARMQKNILDYEPELALFVEDTDALIFYEAIAIKAKEWLKPCGKLYFEINEQKGDAVCTLLTSLDYKNIELRKDLNSKNRMVKGVLYK